MGLTREELDDVIRQSILELAKANGIPAESWPTLSRLAAFDREVTQGRKDEAERSLREHEIRERDWAVRNAQAMAEANVCRAAAAEYARLHRPGAKRPASSRSVTSDDESPAQLHHVAESPKPPLHPRRVPSRHRLRRRLDVPGLCPVFDSPYTIQDEYGEYRETVKPTAFDRSLAQGADCVFLIGHTGAPLARTKSGTLTLSADKRGLLSEAKLDPANPRAQELKSMVDRGDMDQMSFSFRDLLPTWNSDYSERNLRTVELNHGDVSAVAFGANDATAGTVAMRSRFYAAEVRGERHHSPAEKPPSKGAHVPGRDLVSDRRRPGPQKRNPRSRPRECLSQRDPASTLPAGRRRWAS